MLSSLVLLPPAKRTHEAISEPRENLFSSRRYPESTSECTLNSAPAPGLEQTPPRRMFVKESVLPSAPHGRSDDRGFKYATNPGGSDTSSGSEGTDRNNACDVKRDA